MKLTKLLVVAGLIALFVGSSAPTAKAGGNEPPLPRHFYYPYYYFPHSYWPANSPQWPEQRGQPYMRPPAYMAYPPFREPGWRYELFEPQRYYRGHHFWLDQF
jgi:hypothetical protein